MGSCLLRGMSGGRISCSTSLSEKTTILSFDYNVFEYFRSRGQKILLTRCLQGFWWLGAAFFDTVSGAPGAGDDYSKMSV